MGTVPSKPPSRDLEIRAAHQRLEKALLHHALARALQSGSSDADSSRAPLPMEIILQILRLAGYVKLHPSINLRISFSTTQPIRIISPSPAESCLWFSTPPFTQHALNKVVQLRLNTVLKGSGGYCGLMALSPSWFEVAITRPGPLATAVTDKSSEVANQNQMLIRTRSDGSPLSWYSHCDSSSDLQERQGETFPSTHKLWNYLMEGDSISVFIHGLSTAWLCKNVEASLDFWEWFEPTLGPDAELDCKNSYCAYTGLQLFQ